jgi:hypothetical protein
MNRYEGCHPFFLNLEIRKALSRISVRAAKYSRYIGNLSMILREEKQAERDDR